MGTRRHRMAMRTKMSLPGRTVTKLIGAATVQL